MKPVQYFSDEYLQQCRCMSPEQIVQYLDDFRRLQRVAGDSRSRTRLISLKVPENLLSTFKVQAARVGTPYQTQIKTLMRDWVLKRTE